MMVNDVLKRFVLLGWFFLLALVGCSGGGGEAVESGTPGAGAGPENLIALTQFTDTNSEIYFFHMKPDSYEVFQLTNTEHFAYCPVFSPDMNSLAYQYLNSLTNINDIYVMDIADRTRTGPVTAGGVDIRSRLSWSHDNNYLVWSGITPDGTQNDVMRVDVRTGDLVNLTNLPASEDESPDWSPVGRQIVFSSNRDTGDGRLNSNIWVMDWDGSDPKQLTETVAWENIRPTWSPDASQVAFYRWGLAENAAEITEGGPSGLWVMDADGDNQLLLVPMADIWGPGMDIPAWSPDGKYIAYQGGTIGERDIYLVSVVDGTITQLSSLPGEESEVTWSPDGKYLVFTNTTQEDYRLYLAATDGTFLNTLLEFESNGCADWLQGEP